LNTPDITMAGQIGRVPPHHQADKDQGRQLAAQRQPTELDDHVEVDSAVRQQAVIDQAVFQLRTGAGFAAIRHPSARFRRFLHEGRLTGE
jgi:hypothetical protein